MDCGRALQHLPRLEVDDRVGGACGRTGGGDVRRRPNSAGRDHRRPTAGDMTILRRGSLSCPRVAPAIAASCCGERGRIGTTGPFVMRRLQRRSFFVPGQTGSSWHALLRRLGGCRRSPPCLLVLDLRLGVLPNRCQLWLGTHRSTSRALARHAGTPDRSSGGARGLGRIAHIRNGQRGYRSAELVKSEQGLRGDALRSLRAASTMRDT